MRHGESAPARDDQPFPLVDGHGDPELATAGREQAFRLADRLAHEDIAFRSGLRTSRSRA
ncbi:MAG TPA: histidine phosphatase family protein [Acidimicrobiales bacterium]|nr:histidine phosphatase family protein [Acidimicrobiales bacterium]